MKKIITICLLMISVQLFFSTTSSAIIFNPIRIELSPIKWSEPEISERHKEGIRDYYIVSYTDRYLFIDTYSSNDFEVDIVNASNHVEQHEEFASGVGKYVISIAGLQQGHYTIYVYTKWGILCGAFSLDSDL